ncbi:GNAT family N-acetyltransferase [Halopelagius longus]|uniref:Acetyltransferase (GNAT) domain-containing protein n=1 Tax=Halopelagius longus TaxID=1236180 RepID=A0A1H1BKX6_9EURY|nr:GNAT family N-acetyltransferase [Halopelagius longus]SDQ52634.1 Acetyltransferase (GNAT) domain-containing protein [Halopelagius longus]
MSQSEAHENETEYTIRAFRAADVDDFLGLFSETFGSERSRRWFAWKYEDNPYVDHVPIFVAEADGTLVGARPFFALDMSVGGERRLALQPADTMVHPDHRRRGLFTRMTETAIDEYGDAEPSFFFNFPNENSSSGYLNLGWRKVTEQPTYYRIQNPSELARHRDSDALASVGGAVLDPLVSGYNRLSNAHAPSEGGVTVTRHESVPAATMAAIASGTPERGVHVRRDERFYDWRFGNPNWEYVAYVAREAGEPVAGIVVGTSVGSGPTTTKVTDVVPVPRESASDGLEALLHRAVGDHADSDLLAAPAALPASSARRAGFRADDRPPISYVSSRTTHVVRPFDGEWVQNGVDIADEENWRFTFSEQDTS